METETATFALGCFWHVQRVFDRISGIISTSVGYIGGDGVPDYHSAEEKGFAEAVEIKFNPKKTNYERLLDIFWGDHDPTSLNRQRNDIGRRYRSAIFYHDNQQRKIAEESLKKEQKKYNKKIVTEVVKAGEFYEAEEEHQKHDEKAKSQWLS
jgi:peptide-methionine (S)-S-oxide reductase